MKKENFIAGLQSSKTDLCWEIHFFTKKRKGYEFEKAPIAGTTNYATLLLDNFIKNKLDFIDDGAEIGHGIFELNNGLEYLNCADLSGISDTYDSLIEGIQKSKQHLEDIGKKNYKGYSVIGFNAAREIKVLLCRQRDPLFQCQGRMFAFSEDDQLTDKTGELYLLDNYFDSIIYGEKIIMLNKKAEDFFQVTRYYTQTAIEYASKFIGLGLFSDDTKYSIFSSANAYSQGYLNLKNDSSILSKPAKDIIKKAKTELGIFVTPDDKFDCSFDDNLRAINLYLCGKIKSDVSTDKKYIHGAQGKEYRPPIRPKTPSPAAQ